jgi:hypothetical protein
MPRKLTNSTYRPGPLATPADLRRELARLYRDARTGLVATADASRLAGILNIIARLIETSDLELRIERLEELGHERSAEPFEAH